MIDVKDLRKQVLSSSCSLQLTDALQFAVHFEILPL